MQIPEVFAIMSSGLEVVDMDTSEWLGYAASLTILVSFLMRSLKRLRIVNTCGAAIFAAYGISRPAPTISRKKRPLPSRWL